MITDRKKTRAGLLDKLLKGFSFKRGKLCTKDLEAFTRRDIESSIQLYLHISKKGITMDDVVGLMNDIRRVEETQKLSAASRQMLVEQREHIHKLTRDEKKHMRAKQIKEARRRKK